MEERPRPVAVAQERRGGVPGRRVLLVAAATVLAAAAWLVARGAMLRTSAMPPVYAQAPCRSDLPEAHGTVVTPHTEARLEPGRSVLWCATSQMVWDEMARVCGVEALDVRGARDEVGVRAMSLHPFPRDALDPATYVVAGGTAATGVADRFLEALRTTFGGAPVGVSVPSLAPLDAAAFSYLLKDMKFAIPFAKSSDPLTFGASPSHGCARVRSFGGESWQRGEGPLDQVRLHWQDHPLQPGRFVLELLPKSKDRIVLARVDAGETLERTWGEVAGRIAGDGSPLPEFDRFAIPEVQIERIDARFDDLCGRISRRGVGEDWKLTAFWQWIQFRLDETGARLESISGGQIIMGSGPPPERPSYVFDRPFLVALIEKGATRPYFLLWVGNADLLVKAP